MRDKCKNAFAVILFAICLSANGFADGKPAVGRTATEKPALPISTPQEDFEYKVEILRMNMYSTDTLGEFLTDKAVGGWRLINIYKERDYPMFIFERPKSR
jgi:hypothetical protein